MNKLNKVVIVIARIAEVCLWIGAGFSVALMVAGAFFPQWLDFLMGAESASIQVVGFNLDVVDAQGNLIPKAILILGLLGTAVLPLAAMIVRNIHLIFETAAGKTRFSTGTTPFQPAIVRMVRQIGIFCVAIPVLKFLVSLIAMMVLGGDVAEEVEIIDSSAFYGLVVLCLSQFFAYGQSLQEEVDGML